MTQEVDRVAKKLQKRVRDYEVRDVLEFVAAIGLEQYLANFGSPASLTQRSTRSTARSSWTWTR